MQIPVILHLATERVACVNLAAYGKFKYLTGLCNNTLDD